ncbi:MAG: hypothetical protein ABL993_08230 [Vicinamibacterales bacterium]
MMDILPDSRAKQAKNQVFTNNGTWIPVFCANCGKHGGSCPETSTFLFYLCNPCFDKYGPITGTMVVPDQVFYEKMAEEQQHVFGRPATHNELLQVVAEDSTALAKLIKEAK